MAVDRDQVAKLFATLVEDVRDVMLAAYHVTQCQGCAAEAADDPATLLSWLARIHVELNTACSKAVLDHELGHAQYKRMLEVVIAERGVRSYTQVVGVVRDCDESPDPMAGPVGGHA